MLIEIEYPQYFTLIHKKSGLKFNTYNTEFIGYDDEKFIKEEKQSKQSKLF